MLRLAIFLGAVLLLFQAGFHRVPEPPPTAPAAKPAARTLTSRIAARPLARREPAAALPSDAEAPPTPAPFGLSDTTAGDPAGLLPGPDRMAPVARFTVAAPRLPLRAGPSDLYPELGTLSRGETVIISGDTGAAWLWAMSENGLSGYVAAGLVMPAEPVAKPAGRDPVPPVD